MGNQEETKPLKSDKSSLPATPEQTSAHVYPDWAAMQPFYGARVALPPYYGTALSPGQAPPPYIWGPQPMIPPYGTPYPAVYPHAGVYGHPTVPANGLLQTAPSVAVKTPKKPSESTEGSLMKKLRSFGGLAMSIGSGNIDNGDAEADDSTETDRSTDGDPSGEEKSGRKRNSEGLNLTGDSKSEAKILETGVVVDSPINGKLHPIRASSFEVNTPASTDAKKAAANSVQLGPVVPSEARLQTERDLKKERRKQSNRESARRSRLRKQAEAEELSRKVESLTEENTALKSEIGILTETSEKLRIEILSLMEKLGSVQRAEEGKEAISEAKDDDPHPSDDTENLISRINDSGSLPGRDEVKGGAYEKNSKKVTQLHQLLDSKPRTDAVATG